MNNQLTSFIKKQIEITARTRGIELIKGQEESYKSAIAEIVNEKKEQWVRTFLSIN